MLLQSIKASNLLSFGPDTIELPLRPLNLLIGPNGSGKSNLLEAVALLRATAIASSPSSVGDLRDVVRRGGGVTEWVWKGAPDEPASIEAIVEDTVRKLSLRHTIRIREHRQALQLHGESIETNGSTNGNRFSYQLQQGNPIIHAGGQERRIAVETLDPNQSILAQRRDPEAYPEISFLAGAYEGIRIYREWAFGRASVFRTPQAADMQGEPLQEDFSNLGLLLNHLRSVPKAKNDILAHLRDLYDGLDDFDVRIKGGTVEVFLTEGDFTIPARRLSDGTLRYLCLLAILCDPEPPPLICFEEPELGLHPDLLPKVADLLMDASTRTQLIVTTHSDILIDAMTGRPEDVVVFEKRDGKTEASRLDRGALAVWLDKYRLGQLWTRGEIGGTRW